MYIFKCKTCGRTIESEQETAVCVCEHCGAVLRNQSDCRNVVTTDQYHTVGLKADEQLNSKADNAKIKNKHKNKHKKVAIITTLIVCAVIALIIILMTVIIPGQKYREAERLLSNGNIAKAAMTFSMAGNYSDAKERSATLWAQIACRNTVAAGGEYTVGLRSDGTVVAVGSHYEGKCDVSGWTDIIAVAAGQYHIVGLKSDGTVVAVGDNEYGQCDVDEWTDIVAVTASSSRTIGLRADGTVIVTESESTGTQQFYAEYYYGQCDVSDWKDIIAVAAGGSYIVGLKSDGTAVAVGDMIMADAMWVYGRI